MTTQTANNQSGTSKGSQLAELKALMDWPGLYLMSEACIEVRGRFRRNGAGAPTRFPIAVLLFAVMAARITSTQAAAIQALSDASTWESLAAVWESRAETEGIPFPPVCPNREQVRHFVESLTNPKIEDRPDMLGLPGWEETLQDRFQQVALAQARALGHLSPEGVADWTKPSMANTIIGDGTVISPFSNVQRRVDKVTGQIHHVGSRATATPRLSPTSDLTADGKAHLAGLNMVSMLTATEHGWIVLGTAYAPRAEQWASLDLLDSIAARAGGGVHNLLWDRVYNGWLLDYATARHGIRVFNKSYADSAQNREKRSTSKRPSTPDVETPDSDLRHQADMLLGRIYSEGRYRVRAAELSPADQKLLTDAEVKLHNGHLNRHDLRKLHEDGTALPLGISLYRSTSASSVVGARSQSNFDNHEVVRSRFRFAGKLSHESDSGECFHVLYTDDGALHSVESDGTYLVKTATAKCLKSEPRENGHDHLGTVWGTDETWEMPCNKGNFVFSTSWNPSATRHRPESDASSRQSSNKVLNDLRPISRSDAQEFADIANHRNNAESYNNWYQRRLPNTGRAATLSIDSQLFDYLAGACVRNAITWSNWQNS